MTTRRLGSALAVLLATGALLSAAGSAATAGTGSVPTTDLSGGASLPLGPDARIPYLERDPHTHDDLGIRLPDGRRLSWGHEVQGIYNISRAHGGFAVTGTYGAGHLWTRFVRGDGTRRPVADYYDCPGAQRDNDVPQVTVDGRELVTACHNDRKTLLRLIRISDSRVLATRQIGDGRADVRAATSNRVVLSDGRIWHTGSGRVSRYRHGTLVGASLAAHQAVATVWTRVLSLPGNDVLWTTQQGERVDTYQPWAVNG